MRIVKIITGLSFCMLITGCNMSDQTYYIPVENQVGDAKPLSKNDVIRVVMPHNLPDYISNANYYDRKKNNEKWEDLSLYNMTAKRKTEDKLKKLGFNVINTGYHSGGEGHPNVIALVESAPIEGTAEKRDHLWYVPVFTDMMGQATMTEAKGVTLTMQTYYYKVKLVRPEGKDNSLFVCNSSAASRDYCIAPVNPTNYKTIFSGYGTLRTDDPTFTINVDHLITAVLHNYPNMTGKKWVYFSGGGYTPVYVTEPNAPEPKLKK